MNTLVVFAGLLAFACGAPSGGLIQRAPSHDSAVIEHHRLGGNFAYATAESHAYAELNPIISTVTHPVAKTTTVHEPAPIAHVQPGAVYTTKHVAQPIIQHQPILKQEPIIQERTIVEQPVYKTRTYTDTHVQPVATHVSTGYAQTGYGIQAGGYGLQGGY